MTKKTEQAVKISATWTPGAIACTELENAVFHSKALRIRGGRLTINAAVLLDMTDPAQATKAAARVAELRKKLEATGTLHSFTTAAGAVPVGTAERLPQDSADE